MREPDGHRLEDPAHLPAGSPVGPQLPGRGLLRLVACVWATVGLAFLFRPALWGEYVNLFLPTTTARIHLRAIHGGLPLGLAAWFALAAARPSWVWPALTAVGFVHAGLAAATIAGIVTEGGTIPRIIVILGCEITIAVRAWGILGRRRAA